MENELPEFLLADDLGIRADPEEKLQQGAFGMKRYQITKGLTLNIGKTDNDQ